MTARSLLRLTTIVLLLAGAAVVLALGTTLVRHVAGGVSDGVWLFAWSAGFAVLLPVALTFVAVLAPVLRGSAAPAFVPNAGRKIPGAGQ